MNHQGLLLLLFLFCVYGCSSDGPADGLQVRLSQEWKDDLIVLPDSAMAPIDLASSENPWNPFNYKDQKLNVKLNYSYYHRGFSLFTGHCLIYLKGKVDSEGFAGVDISFLEEGEKVKETLIQKPIRLNPIQGDFKLNFYSYQQGFHAGFAYALDLDFTDAAEDWDHPEAFSEQKVGWGLTYFHHPHRRDFRYEIPLAYQSDREAFHMKPASQSNWDTFWAEMPEHRKKGLAENLDALQVTVTVSEENELLDGRMQTLSADVWAKLIGKAISERTLAEGAPMDSAYQSLRYPEIQISPQEMGADSLIWAIQLGDPEQF